MFYSEELFLPKYPAPLKIDFSNQYCNYLLIKNKLTNRFLIFAYYTDATVNSETQSLLCI